MASEDFRHVQTKWAEKAMRSEKYCDAIFIVGRKRKRLYGFRGLLATISPVFEAQFYGSFLEASSIKEPIEYPAIKPYVFECIIRASMNLDPNIDANNVMELIQVCQMFQIPQLQKECLTFLENSLNVDNVLCVLNTGYCLNSLDKKFYKKSLRIVLKNAPSMLRNSGFYSLHPDLLIKFLKSNCFNVKEELLWNATLKWAQTVVNKSLRFPILTRSIYNHHCSIWQKHPTTLSQSVSTNKRNDDHDIDNIDDMNHAFSDLDDDIDDIDVSEDDEDDMDDEDEKEIIMISDYDDNKVDKVLELITPYLRYALMDKQFFIDNVSKYLSPIQRDAVYVHFILTDRCTEIFNDSPRIGYSNKKFDVVASNVRLDKAKMLNHVDDWWSHTNFASISPQWFVVKLADPAYIVTVHWKNRWGDGETAKDVELQVSAQEDKYDVADSSTWKTFWTFKSEKTSNWLTFQVPQREDIKPSMFWRFMVKTLYGDNSCRCGLDQIKITNSL